MTMKLIGYPCALFYLFCPLVLYYLSNRISNFSHSIFVSFLGRLTKI